jgi:ABC-type transport system involved in cytochrome bd biosynthesis fused ATPase/permease subunit
MSIFGKIMSAIFGGSSATAAPAPGASPSGGGTATATATAPMSQVDVEAVLTKMAAANKEKLDWRKSIVDLMKLLGLDSPKLDERAQNYLAQLQLTHKVEVKDGVLSTTELSQGQRKRLALLTAYLEDRQIYVFDEWAADQDPLFKEVFYYQLLPELKEKGKTILVISHDDRYYHIADHIIKLDYGKIDYDQNVAGLEVKERRPVPVNR